MNKTFAVVIGDLSIVRPLGRAGIPVAIATGDPHTSLTRSRYCTRVVPTPSFVEDPAGAVAALLAFGAELETPAVLFPQGDHDLLLVSRERETLAPFYRVALPPAAVVEDLVDKLRFATLAERLSLPVPTTWTLLRGELEARRLSAWQHFPCILKPALRTHWFGSRLHREVVGSNQKAIRVESAAELMRLLPDLRRHETDFVLQEAVPGGEEQIVSYHAYVRPDRVTVGEFTGRKLRTSPRTYGLSTCVEITDDEQVKSAGRDVLARLGFFGVVKLDFKQHPESGRLYLLEANPRFSLWHHPGALAGVNLPALVYRDLAYGEQALRAPKLRPGVRWMSTRQDLHALVQYRAAGELSVPRWLAQVLRADVREDFVFSDPVPGLVDAVATARRFAHRVFRRPSRPSPHVAN